MPVFFILKAVDKRIRRVSFILKAVDKGIRPVFVIINAVGYQNSRTLNALFASSILKPAGALEMPGTVLR